MFKFTTGNILDSSAECLVNTVNCEGYMGKGIAYQFKKKFPENFKSYKDACTSGSLKIGTIHCFRENNKIVINFPTKNKWRENSKMEYIHLGLKELVKILELGHINSIAIPPLGCGNGGLNWNEVRPFILSQLQSVAENIEIIIYEPSKNYQSDAKQAPKLNASHLLLMNFKPSLKKFNKLRLQKAAFFMNLFSGENYFKFVAHKYGPYAHSIDILIREIKEFQDFHKLNTQNALSLAKNTLISDSIETKLQNFLPHIKRACTFINSIDQEKDVELISTICYLVLQNNELNVDNIVDKIKSWSDEKAEKFSNTDILSAVNLLLTEEVLVQNLLNYLEIKQTQLTNEK